jgi:hypothetical protein
MAKAPIEIKSLAREHTESALKTLAHIMREPTAPHSARVAASIALLDRGWGKPDSKHELTVVRKRADEMSDNELASIATGSSEDATDAPLDPSQLN